MTTLTAYKQVTINKNGVPIIADTTMKVVELIGAHQAYGWSPPELHFQFPHLSMSQIHSSLAYYWDHKEELDADMKRRLDYADRSRREAGTSPLAQNLRSQGLLT
jgi:uncharacterized protein (DUF433 family)